MQLVSLTHAWARFYRQHGWSVVPIAPGEKRTLVKWKPYQEALPGDGEIDEWWTRFPDASICVVLGTISGIVAVDSDSAEAHDIFVARLGGVPPTLCARSGSHAPGKFHYFFRPPDFATRATTNPWHPQLEFRGERGILVLPPSLHKSGRRYEWLNLPSTPASFLDAILPLPELVASTWRSHLDQKSKPTPIPTNGPQIQLPNGPQTVNEIEMRYILCAATRGWLRGHFAESAKWNDRLFRAACDLAGSGVTLFVAEPLLLAGARPRTGDDILKARATIASAYGSPRHSAHALASTMNSSPHRRRAVSLTFNVRRALYRSRRRKDFQ